MATAAQIDYARLLTDPRWQRRRLEMLEAAGFKCQRCFCGDKTLHVHHREYIAGRKPWEYTDGQLMVVCEDCHEMQHLPEPSPADVQREQQIAKLERDLIAEPDRVEKRRILIAMESLIRARSPEQVKRIELARGLR